MFQEKLKEHRQRAIKRRIHKQRTIKSFIFNQFFSIWLQRCVWMTLKFPLNENIQHLQTHKNCVRKTHGILLPFHLNGKVSLFFLLLLLSTINIRLYKKENTDTRLKYKLYHTNGTKWRTRNKIQCIHTKRWNECLEIKWIDVAYIEIAWYLMHSGEIFQTEIHIYFYVYNLFALLLEQSKWLALWNMGTQKIHCVLSIRCNPSNF